MVEYVNLQKDKKRKRSVSWRAITREALGAMDKLQDGRNMAVVKLGIRSQRMFDCGTWGTMNLGDLLMWPHADCGLSAH
jgi:hypothetical protein|tara:strand:- start:3683 stop:3919 length:237 start_codon:yes stop_codon:yes gene_type:complete